MEIVGITVEKNGQEVEQFFLKCIDHNYVYSKRPPLTHGCRDCWTAYYVGEWVSAGAKREDVDGLEQVIRHAAESASKGQFDFKPDYRFKIEHED